MNAKKSRGIKRPVVLWTIAIVAVTALMPLGSSLVGRRVFFPADLLQVVDPWKQTAPPDFRRANALIEDPLNADMPMLAEYRRRLYEGDYPLWSSYPSGGIPLGTTATRRSLSPFTVPYILLPLWYAPAFVKLFEMAAAVVFTFLFLKRIGLTSLAAVVGGLIYMNSGFQVVWTNWPQSHIGALIPGLFWAGELIVQGRTLRAMVPASILTAVMLLEGYPPVAGYAVIVAGIYVVARVARSRQSGTRERLAVLERFGGAIVLGAGIAALQILPFLDRLRELDVGYRQQAPGAHLPLRALVTLVFPNAFGSPVDGNYYGALHYQRAGYVVLNYQELQGFIGAAALVLVLIGATRVRRGHPTSDRLPPAIWPYLWLGSGILAALIYAGGLPLRMLQATPLFDLAFIGRLRCILGFFLAVLAAIGLQAVADDPQGESRSSRLLTVALVMGAGVLAAFGLRDVWRLAGEAHQRRYMVTHAILPIVAGGIGLALVGLGPWRGVGRRLRVGGQHAALWILPVLISVESLAFAVPFWPRVPKALFYPSTPAHRFLRQHLGADRMASGGKAMYPGANTFYALRSLNAHAFEDPSWRDLITLVDPRAFSPVRPTWALLHPDHEVVRSAVLDRLSVRYFVNPLSAPVQGRRVELTRPVEGTVLGAGHTLTATIPPGKIRAVALTMMGLQGSSEAVLQAQILDVSGRVLSQGARRLRPGNDGSLFEIPVVEVGGQAQEDQPRSVRLSLRGRGLVSVAADRTGAPSLSIVLGEEDGLKLVFATGVAIYERLDALPRIRWAGKARVIPTPSDRLQALETGVAPDTVILSEEGPRGSAGGARLRLLEDSGDEIRVKVEALGAGYLVVADALQDGWSASVDGQPAVLRPADHALGAVYVPVGRHEVSLRYDPKGWRIGQPISAISAVLLLLVALSGRPARRLLRRA